MGHLGSNQYILEEVFAASVTEAFEHLKQIGSLYPLSPFTASLEGLTQHIFGVGSKWREHRRHLFLRDVMECEVVQCAAPASFSIASNDGFNQLRYDFSLTELDTSTTAVRCTVHCYTSPGGQGQTASPSEKLAIMMQNQDRFAIRQMKGAFEAEHALSVY